MSGTLCLKKAPGPIELGWRYGDEGRAELGCDWLYGDDGRAVELL